MSNFLRNIPTQSTFFYDELWNEERDSCFIQALLSQHELGNWNRAEVNGHALLWSKVELERRFGIELTWDDIYIRCQGLRQRYDIFKEITRTSGFWWNESENKVHAHPTEWKRMIEKFPFAKSYYHQGENEFKKLVVLFDAPAYGVCEGPVEVIQLSSGSIPQTNVHNISSIISISSDDNDEVRSYHPVPRHFDGTSNLQPFVLIDEEEEADELDSSDGVGTSKNASMKMKREHGSSSSGSLGSLKSLFSFGKKKK